jgi:predicted nucleic-acid-binding protein
MRAVDTNVLVRLIIRDDPRQTASAESFVREGAWVPLLALAETTWVLSSVYDLDSAALATTVQMLLDHRELALERPPVVAAALAHFRATPTVSFSACLMIESARAAGHLPLGTFDRKLSRLGGAQLL